MLAENNNIFSKLKINFKKKNKDQESRLEISNKSNF